ncbi:hypothetical protein PF005_g22903 [Phytophthora fragariae]|uniref:Uncharacterized protein n=1 Tax=Phytophthora fragariae TaxID=53985 RepID=A0A6A4C880_9STRA|nr:hypothetical protein PF003_g11981 [Phytophthora fragariae]KAE8928132.1 hypothetical protein PF009_g21714 [Phytophthora fragariae]KAE9080320.1 hypothetical protein PF007_g23092 [Phytophthora fragariae]KAE9080961.1 hypothetical protein PF010_g22187 [Phytophthora fragariae]KAE9103425.1 hypothetical protein PF006_g22184 [Phytophthora fragariae]
MEHLLNDDAAPDADEAAVVKSEPQPLPHLAAQLAASAASLGLHMLSVSAAAPAHVPTPPRLPPISLLTAAAAALQPAQCHPLQPPAPQLRPVLTTPLHAAAAPSTSTSASPPAADDMLCRYRNKKCGYPRAIKRNGERHNLCERHRAKANQNQRKLESKRRTQKRMLQQRVAAVDRVVKAKKAVETEVAFTLYGGAVA